MQIGELARATQTRVETIRHYEREGLLPAPPRSGGNYRLYDVWHVDRLVFVRHCRSLDMTLDEIRQLLRIKDNPGADCAEVDALLSAHRGHVAARIRELQHLQRQLAALQRRCAGAHTAAECGILRGLTQMPDVAAPPAPVAPACKTVDAAHGGLAGHQARGSRA